MKKTLNITLFLVILIANSCNTNNDSELPNITTVLSSSVIYEVNIRQYTPEGTFNAFQEHLPRLKNLGVDILWLMPIHPISMEKRKGKLGSYYAVADYTKVNPEFGTLKDFRSLVDEAHKQGMYVILDWVANHTGWDNPWIFEHPEWYTKNDSGEIISPVADWTDVADLNYEMKPMRSAMTEALKFWVKELNIDGYRCDVAGSVPVDYWEEARLALDSIKPVFMLAEAWEPELMHNAFQMAYAWNGHHIMNEVAQGKQFVSHIENYFNDYLNQYQRDDILMNFITNHDENSWNGTAFERLGEGVESWAVFSYLIPGMPLIYSGQEASLNKRLRFFSKDTISWNDTSLYNFYRQLNQLKQTNTALGVGIHQGQMNILTCSDTNIFAFSRASEMDTIIGVFNFSLNDVKVDITMNEFKGIYSDFNSADKILIDSIQEFTIDRWGYKLLFN